MSPYRDTRPYVGFSPTTPQQAAGWRIDPPVSVPRAATHSSAATAAAEPPLEPPGTWESFQGFRLAPKAEYSVEEPIPNSSRLVLPIRKYCCDRNASTAVAEYGGTKPPRMRDPHVVGRPSVQMLSLTAIGIAIMGSVFLHALNA